MQSDYITKYRKKASLKLISYAFLETFLIKILSRPDKLHMRKINFFQRGPR